MLGTRGQTSTLAEDYTPLTITPGPMLAQLELRIPETNLSGVVVPATNLEPRAVLTVNGTVMIWILAEIGVEGFSGYVDINSTADAKFRLEWFFF